MLHTTTVYPPTLELLRELMKLPALEGFNLAGGTALALQIGHRISVDLDFFGDVDFEGITILDSLRDIAEIKIINQSRAIFEDAEEDDIPSVFDKSVTWPIVKRTIELEAKKL